VKLKRTEIPGTEKMVVGGNEKENQNTISRNVDFERFSLKKF